ncbi:MAG: glycosyltransferase family 39 protein [Bryobacterales bacterium]|nr:glycosyltransferase family 39 protein [Bryobacterales bacterium]
MDDVDAVQAQIARNMLDSGDWVTARLNGIAYLEKAPLKYWMIAVSYMIFGVSDWAARIPIVLSCIALCWITARMGAWAFSPRAGLYAGLVLATSVGLWLFTRILIPDVVLTLTIAVALWAFLRALEEDTRWAWGFWAALGTGFLLKGLIAMVFPVAAVLLYLTVTRQWPHWRKLKPLSGAVLTLAIAAPWVVLATLRNPPYFDFTMRSVKGEYHGFFWFFFLNEHLFRFLNMRYPRDYNTVPRALFWAFHLLWFFPWSAWLWNALRGGFNTAERAGRLRLLCLLWLGFILLFFTFSTTQEYYSMPAYPAFALLLGAALAGDSSGWPARLMTVLTAVIALLLGALFFLSRNYPTPGDISQALTLNPEAYTLSLGHMQDLTLPALAYLRAPLLVATLAFAVGCAGTLLKRWRVAALVAMMLLFTQAARMALVVFDPYLSSRPLAEALKAAPPGEVVLDNQYYTFSSVFFYAGLRKGWLLNGRVNNLEYGSYAPGAIDVWLDDDEFVNRWQSGQRHYLLIEGPSVPRLSSRVQLHQVATAGGKFLFTNLAAVQPGAAF